MFFFWYLLGYRMYHWVEDDGRLNSAFLYRLPQGRRLASAAEIEQMSASILGQFCFRDQPEASLAAFNAYHPYQVYVYWRAIASSSTAPIGWERCSSRSRTTPERLRPHSANLLAQLAETATGIESVYFESDSSAERGLRTFLELRYRVLTEQARPLNRRWQHYEERLKVATQIEHIEFYRQQRDEVEVRLRPINAERELIELRLA